MPLQKLKQLLKSCFAARDNETDQQLEKARTIETRTVSQTSSFLSGKTDTIKVIATPTVIEIPTPPTQQALIVASKHTYALDNAFPMPEIQSGDEVLIRNCAVGLNPIDWKSVDWNFCLPAFPWVTGREMSGVIEQVGENVTEYKKGDRVWTSTYYRDIRSGCFQEFVIAPRHTVKRIPSNLSFEEAACLGVCGLTGAMTLWKWLEVPIRGIKRPTASVPEYLLVWGGSSVTGQFIIQIAAHSGLEVIAVASERTKTLVSSLGADHVITRDGKSNEQIVAEIRAIGGNKILKGIDIVGPETSIHCMAALSTSSPVLFAPLSFLPKDAVAPAHVSVQNVEMKCFVLDKSSEVYADALNRLLAENIVRPPALEVLSGGLSVVEAGLNVQKRGDRGGQKLIVSMRS